jgi:uncharacterized protein (DUF1697 family)
MWHRCREPEIVPHVSHAAGHDPADGGLPDAWVNDTTMKCDVMFLWPTIDSSNVLEQIPHNPEIEDVIYLPGVVVWRIDRDKVNGGQMPKIIGSDIHKQLTVRNPNTVRKLYALMRADTISP